MGGGALTKIFRFLHKARFFCLKRKFLVYILHSLKRDEILSNYRKISSVLKALYKKRRKFLQYGANFTPNMPLPCITQEMLTSKENFSLISLSRGGEALVKTSVSCITQEIFASTEIFFLKSSTIELNRVILYKKCTIQ